MPSYESLDNVSWAEFRIRLFAFKRMQDNEIEKLRILAYKNMEGVGYAISAALSKGGKMPHIDKFWSINRKQTKEDLEKQNKRMNVLRMVKQEYLKKKNGE